MMAGWFLFAGYFLVFIFFAVRMIRRGTFPGMPPPPPSPSPAVARAAPDEGAREPGAEIQYGSAHWVAFMQDYRGGRDWHDYADGFDTRALHGLEDEEREHATQLLLARLESGDTRITRALGEFVSDPRVRDALEQHLTRVEPAAPPIFAELDLPDLNRKLTCKDRIATAAILLKLGPHDAAERVVLEGLRDPCPDVVYEALAATKHLGRAALAPVLAVCVRAESAPVKMTAMRQALFLAGIHDSPHHVGEHRDLLFQVANGDRAARQSGFAVLLRLLDIEDTYTGPRP